MASWQSGPILPRPALDAGLAFIGPKPSSIAAMGDKAVARRHSARPGCRWCPARKAKARLSDDELLALAPQIGFPLLIKATAGGGGKGMREVRTLEEMPGSAAVRPP